MDPKRVISITPKGIGLADGTLLVNEGDGVLINTVTYKHTVENNDEVWWDIQKALDIIAQDHDRPVWSAPLANLADDKEDILRRYVGLDENYAMNTDHTKPVILAQYNGIYWLIDGWHRAYKRVVMGLPDIEFYVFENGEEEKIRMFTVPACWEGTLKEV